MKLLQRVFVLGATAISVIVLVPPALASASVKLSALPNGQVGVPYNQTITATGGVAPYTFSLVTGNPPAGITLGSDGTVSGTASANEFGTFTVQATDSSPTPLTGSRKYTLYFGLVFSTKSLAAPQIGTAYSKQIVVKGGTAPLTFSVTGGSLPQGISLSSSGLVSGTTTTPNTTSTFTVGVTDAGNPQQSNSQTYTMKVGWLGQWTLCTWEPSGVHGIDGVRLESGHQLVDNDGATGTWSVNTSDRLTISNFVNRDYVGNWDAPNNQFDGTVTFGTTPDGTFAMAPGADAGPNCVQP